MGKYERHMVMSRRYTLQELERFRTLSVGQTSDLKIDDPFLHERVWLSRCDVASGEPYPNKVTVEHLIDGKWRVVETYQALEEEDD